MIDPVALSLAAELGGTLLGGAGGGLLLVERLAGHGLPQVLILGRGKEDLAAALEAAGTVHAAGLPLNVLAVLPLADCDLETALATHRQRLGALVCALDTGLPWLAGKPMLARRLPGRLRCDAPLALTKAPMGPLEKAELKAFLADWDKERRKRVFRRPEWRETPEGGGFEADLWPGVPVPQGAEVRAAPLALPEATSLTDALRAALREATGQPVPFLPLPGDPGPLHALRALTLEGTAFRGPTRAWELAFAKLASLPAPAHFCGRC
ncbi:hypothetical protein [Geothrix sp. 21YS21S-4]|uniref:hypothetical protein n=1 Tax=Geothrix sp. 21YS21S-4 TaxID=3068889 RepID=UPI0027B8BDE8|nr:hypothetical protein [Geothrix sp. 21YS21S-4]